jgi:hypothetical protein
MNAIRINPEVIIDNCRDVPIMNVDVIFHLFCDFIIVFIEMIFYSFTKQKQTSNTLHNLFFEYDRMQSFLFKYPLTT